MLYSLKQRFLLLILIIVSISIYLNSLNSEKFLIDDIPIIEEFVQNDYTLYDMVRIDKGRTYKSFYDGSYRPLFGLSLWVDFSLWFDGTRGYHLTNLFLHVLNVVLVFYLSKKVWMGTPDVIQTAFISALIFSVHPIHTEAVDWISGRQDPMAAFFTGLSLLVYLNWKSIKSFSYPVFAALFFFLGLMSRELTVALIPILVVYETVDLFYGKREKDFSGVYRLLLIVPVLLSIFIFFNILQHQFALNYQSSPGFAPLAAYLEDTGLLTICYENTGYLGYYILKLFFPVPLNYSTIGIYLPFYFAFAAVSLPSLVYVARREKVLLFLLFASILSILPNLPAKFFSWTVVAERYLYMPSMFFFIGAGFFISRFINTDSTRREYSVMAGKPFRMLTVVCALLLMTALTVARNRQWNSNYLFWNNAVKKNPDSSSVILKYAGVLGGNYVTFIGQEENKSLLKHAPLIKPAELLPGNGYAMIEKVVKRAARLGDSGGYLVLAVMAKADKNPEKVKGYLEKVDPDGVEGGTLLTYTMMWVYLSKNAEELGLSEEELVLKAIKYLKKYLTFRKRDDSNILKLARLYIKIFRYKEAAEILNNLLKTDNLPFIQKRAALRLRKKIESAH